MMYRIFSLLLAISALSMATLAAASDKALLQGDLIQGAVVFGQAEPGATVLLDGQAVRVAEDGRFILGFDRDAPAEQKLSVNGVEQTLHIAPREYRIQRIEGISKKIMDPNEEDLKRIRAESAQIRKARGLDEARIDFDAGFDWPVTGPISGVYGSQRVYNGRPSRPHYGVDVAVPTGTLVVAPTDGLITLAHPDMFYSGGTVILDHGHGLSSSFLHLSKVLVEAGQAVRRGDPIGEVGATGRATGPHLDWRMNWRDTRVDPQRLAGDMPTVDAVEDNKGVGDDAR